MKFRLGLLTLTALAPLAAHAQPVEGLYIGGGVGFDYLNEFKNKDIQLQTPNPNGQPGTQPILGGGRLKSNGGFVGLASIGYGFGNGLRVEVEGNYRQNHTRLESSNTLVGGGQLQQYGAMVNALYDLPLDLSFAVPYAGLGVGYIWNTLQNGNIRTNPNLANGSTVGLDFNNSNPGSVAGQAILGLAFPLSYALSLTTEFRFLGEFQNPSFKGRPTVNGAIVPGATQQRVKFDSPTNESFLIGLRYAFNAAPPPPPPAPAPIAAPAPAPARTYLVFFDWDRADLTERARQIIAEAAANVPKVQVTRIEVNGYTDLSGTPAYNQRLSVRRAESVQAQLIKDGVDRNLIEIHGFGESNPLVPTARGVREPQNRRVEIIFK